MSRPHQVAKIDETLCIGCTKCIQVCPFDAILGANKQMHVVLASLCIGCDLCLPPCPVDAISLIDVATLSSIERAQEAKKRYHARKIRLARIEEEKSQRDTLLIENMQDIIAQSMERAALKQGSVDKNQWEHHE